MKEKKLEQELRGRIKRNWKKAERIKVRRHEA